MPTERSSVDKLILIKTNKFPEHDEINFNIVRTCFAKLCEPWEWLFSLSFKKSIFPENLKIAQVTPVFKAVDNIERSNYGPVAILPCFLSALCTAAYINTYWIQTFSIKTVLIPGRTLNSPCNSTTCIPNT